MEGLAQRMAPDAGTEDIVQDALLRAWLKWGLFDEARGTPRTWLLAITAGIARRRRTPTRTTVSAGVDDYANAEYPAPDIDLRRAIRALPDRQREAIVRFYYVGMTVQDVAVSMSCRPGTVKSLLFEGRKSLRGKLREA